MSRKWITLLIPLTFIFSLAAISQPNEIPVEIVVEKLQHKDIRSLLERSTEAVFKFYYDEVNAAHVISEKCLVVRSKEAEKSVDVSADPELAPRRKLTTFKIPSTADAIHVKLETYEDDQGDVCVHDKGDDFYYLTPLDIKLADLTPGVFSSPITITSEKEKYSVVIRVRTGIPQPVDIVQDDANDINDASKAVTLRSSLNMQNKQGLTFQWEYKVANAAKWTELGRPTVASSVVFFPIRDIFINPIKKNQEIQLRLKAISPELQSPYATPITLRFTPEAPKFNTTNDVTITPTCPNSSSGSLQLKNIVTEADTVTYYIVKSKTLDSTNFPDVVNSSVKVKSGTAGPQKILNIGELDEGDYTAVVYNAGMPVGKVFTSYPFSISKYATLSIKTLNVENATCEAIPDGQISVTVNGGNPAKLTYYLDPPAGKRTIEDRKVTYTELPPGRFSLMIVDECSQNISKKDIDVLAKAAPLNGELSIENMTVPGVANGSVKVKIQGGSGNFNYSVLGENGLLKEEKASSKTFAIEHLPKGHLRLKVADALFPACSLWDTSFVMTEKAVENNHDNGKTKDSVVSTQNGHKPGYTRKDDRLVFYGATERTTETFGAYKENPGKDDYYIVIEKSKGQLSVYDSKDNLIKIYPVVFGSKDQGDKMMEGDRKTPEGTYSIIEKKGQTEWYRFLGINYPQPKDYKNFAERKKEGLIPAEAKIGGNIGIHGTREDNDFEVDRGNQWTDGCIATKNNYIAELYNNIPVGTRVIIKK